MNFKKKLIVSSSVAIVGIAAAIVTIQSPLLNPTKNAPKDFSQYGLHVEPEDEEYVNYVLDCEYYLKSGYGYLSVCTRYDNRRIYVSIDYTRSHTYHTTHIQYMSHIMQRNENGEFEEIGYRTGIVSDNPDPKIGRSNFDISNINHDGDIMLEFELYGSGNQLRENLRIQSAIIPH